eukprot:TRINITY_DN3473_c0_g1_i3.p2 TRINITY_DN3473_c0_g1~~TRINITY_DN3473_c0_g1_i3.p2  ORF type:complete len:118 (-),score=11.84 TRINITY_DN3473_c0_g1_i3:81-434(-)
MRPIGAPKKRTHSTGEGRPCSRCKGFGPYAKTCKEPLTEENHPKPAAKPAAKPSAQPPEENHPKAAAKPAAKPSAHHGGEPPKTSSQGLQACYPPVRQKGAVQAHPQAILNPKEKKS